MPTQIWRLVKIEDGQWQQPDNYIASVNLKKLQHTRKGGMIQQAIPQEVHLVIPMGVEPREYSVSFEWDEYDQCGSSMFTNFGNTLKQWDCSSLYYLNMRDTSGFHDVEPDDQYVIAKSIEISRVPPGLSKSQVVDSVGRLYKRWEVTMNLLTAPTPSMLMAPAFELPVLYGLPTLRTDGFIGLRMENIDDPTEYFDRPLTKIALKYTTSPPSFAIPNEVPVMILPPLGTIGPIIDIEFWLNSNEDYDRVKRWATGVDGDTVLKCTKTSYEEVDDDEGDTIEVKNSKWIIAQMQVVRGLGSGGAYDPVTDVGRVDRKVTMSLIRYWKWELMV